MTSTQDDSNERRIPPGRPIVSGNGTLTEYLSEFVDECLQPLLKHVKSYIQDTTHFLQKLNDLDEIPSNTLLVTMDVSALYTNIPHDEGIHACTVFLARNGSSTNFISDVKDITKFILNHNYFTFDDQFYLQTHGTAMGTKMAPVYANLFMAYLEERFLDECRLM